MAPTHVTGVEGSSAHERFDLVTVSWTTEYLEDRRCFLGGAQEHRISNRRVMIVCHDRLSAVNGLPQGGSNLLFGL